MVLTYKCGPKGIKIAFLISPVTRRELILHNHLSTNLTFFVSFWRDLQSDCRFCKKQCQRKCFSRLFCLFLTFGKQISIDVTNVTVHHNWLLQLRWGPSLTMPVQRNVCAGPSISAQPARKCFWDILITDRILDKGFIHLFYFKNSLKRDLNFVSPHISKYGKVNHLFPKKKYVRVAEVASY